MGNQFMFLFMFFFVFHGSIHGLIEGSSIVLQDDLQRVSVFRRTTQPRLQGSSVARLYCLIM